MASTFSIIFLISAVSAVVVIVSITRITLKRRSSYAWINILFTIFMAITGWELVQYALSPFYSVPLSVQVMRLIEALAVIACAGFVIPMQKRICDDTRYAALDKANRLLHYHTQLLDEFLNELPAVTFALDSNGRVIYMNDRFDKYFGVPRDTIIGQDLAQWMDAQTAEEIGGNNQLVLSTQKKHVFMENVTHQGIQTKWLTTKFPIRDPQGNLLLAGISLEVTEALKSEALDCLLASLVELLPDAIYTVDGSGLLTSWNAGAQRMLGYTAEEAIGMPHAKLAPADLHQEPLIAEPDLPINVVDLETVRIAKDGTHKDVLISASNIPSFSDGKQTHSSRLARDISWLKETEQHLLALNQELNKRLLELSQANKELHKARDLALEAASLKSAFVANISHELRTPLSAILGLSELLLKKSLDSGMLEMSRAIADSAQALLTIINDILDLSKLEGGSIRLEAKPFDPTILIQDCVTLMSPSAQSKSLSIDTHLDVLPPTVIADPTRLRQVLLNLLGNAIKFTKHGGITVRGEIESQDTRQLTLKITVRDTGIGIAAKEREVLFDPFYRADRSSRNVSGTGLGLAISKRLIELMGGEIDFQSQVNDGSKFWITVPLELVHPEQSSGDMPSAVQSQQQALDLLSRHRVLSVEDNATLNELVMRQLAHIGIKADSVANGQDAIVHALSQPYSIILLDIHLPDVDGYEVAKRIRQTEQLGNLKRKVIIAVTAGAMMGDREKALQSGMDDYLSKPVTVTQLRATILQWLCKLEGSDADATAIRHRYPFGHLLPR